MNDQPRSVAFLNSFSLHLSLPASVTVLCLPPPSLLLFPLLFHLLPTRSHYTPPSLFLLLHQVAVVVVLVLFCIWPLVSCSYLQLQRLLLRFHTHTCTHRHIQAHRHTDTHRHLRRHMCFMANCLHQLQLRRSSQCLLLQSRSFLPLSLSLCLSLSTLGMWETQSLIWTPACKNALDFLQAHILHASSACVVSCRLHLVLIAACCCCFYSFSCISFCLAQLCIILWIERVSFSLHALSRLKLCI